MISFLQRRLFWLVMSWLCAKRDDRLWLKVLTFVVILLFFDWYIDCLLGPPSLSLPLLPKLCSLGCSGFIWEVLGNIRLSKVLETSSLFRESFVKSFCTSIKWFLPVFLLCITTCTLWELLLLVSASFNWRLRCTCDPQTDNVFSSKGVLAIVAVTYIPLFILLSNGPCPPLLRVDSYSVWLMNALLLFHIDFVCRS